MKTRKGNKIFVVLPLPILPTPNSGLPLYMLLVHHTCLVATYWSFFAGCLHIAVAVQFCCDPAVLNSGSLFEMAVKHAVLLECEL